MKKIVSFLLLPLCGSMTDIKIHISLCNENQLDALFILRLFPQSSSTCFGYICSPSSGGILYIYNNWYVLYFLLIVTVCWPANRQSTKKHNTYQLLYIYIIPPDDARGSAVGWGTALQVGRSRIQFPMVSLEFFIDIILPAALWLWGWLSL